MPVSLASCYTCHVPTGQGPSYKFWLRVQREMSDQSISQRELIARSGVTHTIINNLQHTGIRDRVARKANVLAIAHALHLPDEEALGLAGLTGPATADGETDTDDVRAVIAATGDLDDEQKDALYRMLDLFTRDRPRRTRGTPNDPAALRAADSA
jgi:hypothetical protein